MKNISYLRSILWVMLISLLIFILAVCYQIGAPTESSRWVYEIYTIKSNIAKKIKEPKLIVVAGSNALFGISCKMIYEETGVNCVNGGTHAGVGIDYMLSRARDWVKPGDLVLLPLEYYHYKHDGKPRTTEIDLVFSRDPSYFNSVNLITKFYFISGISFKRLLRGISAKFTPNPPWKSFYDAKNLNEYGDETSNREAEMTEKLRKKVARSWPHGLERYIKSSQGMRSISKFVDWCRQNNIQVIAMWPNTIWFDVYREARQQEFFQSIEDFYQRIGVKLLGKPEDFMYDKSMFYDSNDHLHDRGVRLRTKQLIELLKPDLAKVASLFKALPIARPTLETVILGTIDDQTGSATIGKIGDRNQRFRHGSLKFAVN